MLMARTFLGVQRLLQETGNVFPQGGEQRFMISQQRLLSLMYSFENPVPTNFRKSTTVRIPAHPSK